MKLVLTCKLDLNLDANFYKQAIIKSPSRLACTEHWLVLQRIAVENNGNPLANM